MKTLNTRLDEYLALRRALGFDLAFTERVLRRFVTYADLSGHNHLTASLFLAWKADFGKANNNTWAARLGMVRSFAAWLQGHDERTEIPRSDLVAGTFARSRPHIYTDGQIVDLLGAARKLTSPYGLRGLLWQTVFGLIATTGLRISEALALDCDDVDIAAGTLDVRGTKNGNDRLIPLASSTVEQLIGYVAETTRLLGKSPLGRFSPFFLQENRRRPTDCSARYNFAQISQMLGLRERQNYKKHGRGPRIHDLRHTFAVNTILDWFREGLDIDSQMYALSTYLGHSSPQSTYWYIEAVPELLQLACERAERRYQEAEL